MCEIRVREYDWSVRNNSCVLTFVSTNWLIELAYASLWFLCLPRCVFIVHVTPEIRLTDNMYRNEQQPVIVASAIRGSVVLCVFNILILILILMSDNNYRESVKVLPPVRQFLPSIRAIAERVLHVSAGQCACPLSAWHCNSCLQIYRTLSRHWCGRPIPQTGRQRAVDSAAAMRLHYNYQIEFETLAILNIVLSKSGPNSTRIPLAEWCSTVAHIRLHWRGNYFKHKVYKFGK